MTGHVSSFDQHQPLVDYEVPDYGSTIASGMPDATIPAEHHDEKNDNTMFGEKKEAR